MQAFIDDRGPVLAVGRATGWWWGTKRTTGSRYAGRAHVVHPDQPTTGLCGRPVDYTWVLRPSTPEHLCPDCCVLAMAASYPLLPRLTPSRDDVSTTAAIPTSQQPVNADDDP